MTRAILPNSILAQLPDLNGQLELCNEEGQTIGFFVPPDMHHAYMYAWAKAQFTDDEARQAREDIRRNGGMMTAEAIAHLESLSRPEENA